MERRIFEPGDIAAICWEGRTRVARVEDVDGEFAHLTIFMVEHDDEDLSGATLDGCASFPVERMSKLAPCMTTPGWVPPT